MRYTEWFCQSHLEIPRYLTRWNSLFFIFVHFVNLLKYCLRIVYFDEILVKIGLSKQLYFLLKFYRTFWDGMDWEAKTPYYNRHLEYRVTILDFRSTSWIFRSSLLDFGHFLPIKYTYIAWSPKLHKIAAISNCRPPSLVSNCHLEYSDHHFCTLDHAQCTHIAWLERLSSP